MKDGPLVQHLPLSVHSSPATPSRQLRCSKPVQDPDMNVDVAVTPTNTLPVGNASPGKTSDNDASVLRVFSNIATTTEVVRIGHLQSCPTRMTDHNQVMVSSVGAVESVTTVSRAKESIKNILDMVEASGMSLTETAALEDEMFEAFSKLRKKRQQMTSR